MSMGTWILPCLYEYGPWDYNSNKGFSINIKYTEPLSQNKKVEGKPFSIMNYTLHAATI